MINNLNKLLCIIIINKSIVIIIIHDFQCQLKLKFLIINFTASFIISLQLTLCKQFMNMNNRGFAIISIQNDYYILLVDRPKKLKNESTQ